MSGAADDLVERLIATLKEKEKRCSLESETRVGVLCLGISRKSRPSGWMSAFKSRGKGWQTRINDVLEDYINSHPKA